MYKGPIEVYTKEVVSSLGDKIDETIFEAVRRVGVSVDKDELIRALLYDREQYDKGYSDAKAEIVRCKDCAHYELVDDMFPMPHMACVGGITSGCLTPTDKDFYCGHGVKKEA